MNNNVNIDSELREELSVMFEISDSRYYSVEDVAGNNWRDELETLEDEWE